MRLTRLTEGFGAETDAISADFGEVWRAFFDAQVLVFRQQKLKPDEFLAFARQFGKPEPHVTLVIWDNASLLHSATLTDPDDPRTLWRITIKEERRPS